MRDIKIIIGENINRYRLEANLNKTNFGKEISYNPSNVNDLEAGLLNCGIDKLKEIAEVLAVDVIDLVEDWSR